MGNRCSECDADGTKKELRPYGVNHALICIDCVVLMKAKQTEENFSNQSKPNGPILLNEVMPNTKTDLKFLTED